VRQIIIINNPHDVFVASVPLPATEAEIFQLPMSISNAVQSQKRHEMEATRKMMA